MKVKNFDWNGRIVVRPEDFKPGTLLLVNWSPKASMFMFGHGYKFEVLLKVTPVRFMVLGVSHPGILNTGCWSCIKSPDKVRILTSKSELLLCMHLHCGEKFERLLKGKK